jgi:basic amino acid/polyamine antiporter, APA family
MSAAPEPTPRSQPGPPVNRIGLFDATMVVIGGIVGSGIFIAPYVVARQVHTPLLILGAWVAGGAIALLGSFIWAELASLRPDVGGQYAYLRDAFHPLVGFLYGWALLLVIQTGGMAAVTITFARYFLELNGLRLPEWIVAVIAIALLTVVNCAGVRPGARAQSLLTILKIAAIAALVTAGILWMVAPRTVAAQLAQPSDHSLTPSSDSFSAFLSALIPVLFAFGGWQTANFIAAEVRDPRRNLPRALIYGVIGVILLYLAVNFVCVYVLGAQGLAATTTPASAVVRAAWGSTGARLIAVGIAVSALGFLSQSVLTAPRVYFAMADDGSFFRVVAHVNPRTGVPDVAIVLQSVWATVIALSGRFEQILNYVTSMDWVFFGLTALTVFVFRRRAILYSAGSRTRRDVSQLETDAGVDARHYTTSPAPESRNSKLETRFRTPGHPFTTIAFVIASFAVVINTVYRYPGNTLIGFAILLAGVPAYYIWRRTK